MYHFFALLVNFISFRTCMSMLEPIIIDKSSHSYSILNTYTKTSPKVMDDASTCTWNPFAQSGNTKINGVTIVSFKMSKLYCHSSFQVNLLSFFKCFSIRLVICAYPLVKILYYHVCPKVALNYRTEVLGGRLTMIAIFAGSMINPCLHTTWPSNIPNGEKKTHFFKFREI